jgi:hypothetical protein
LPFRARINVAIAVLALAKLFWAKANKIKIIAITALKGGAIQSSPKMLNRDKKVERPPDRTGRVPTPPELNSSNGARPIK